MTRWPWLSVQFASKSGELVESRPIRIALQLSAKPPLVDLYVRLEELKVGVTDLIRHYL